MEARPRGRWWRALVPNVTPAAAVLGVVVVVGSIGGGIVIKRSMDREAALEAEKAALQVQIEALNAKQQQLQAQLARAKDPAEVATLRAQLDAEKDRNTQLQNQPRNSGQPVMVGLRAVVAPTTSGSAHPGKPCNCTPGDALCSCL
jgi:colicin import membrane protein